MAAGWSVDQIVRLRAYRSWLPDEEAEAVRDERARWRRGRREMCWLVYLARLYDSGAFDETPIQLAA